MTRAERPLAAGVIVLGDASGAVGDSPGLSSMTGTGGVVADCVGRSCAIQLNMRVEQTLLDGGHGHAVIEHATGRPVIGFMSGNQQSPDMICEVFVLTPRSWSPITSSQRCAPDAG